jgi:hypothetical protein
MGRKVRMVPPDWEHPRTKNGKYIPLMDGLCEALSGWHREKSMWDLGYRKGFGKDEPAWIQIEEKYAGPFEEWSGEAPDPEDYMPDWAPEFRTHLQMYEDTSEGTPISPVMKTPEELAGWLADTGASAFGRETATYEGWLATCRRGSAPSAVMTVYEDGTGTIQSGVGATAALGTKPDTVATDPE